MNGSLPMSLKRKVYHSCIIMVLTYGTEKWRLTKRVQLKLKMTQQAIEKKMMGGTLRSEKRAEWVKEQTRVNDILVEIKKKPVWAEYVMRRHDNHWPFRVTEWVLTECKHAMGLPQVGWADEIKKFAGITWPQLVRGQDSRRSVGEAFYLQWA